MWGFLIAGAAFVFITGIVKMALTHAERMQRIKYGYPLDGAGYKKDEYIDYSGRADQQCK
jgi:hypothetical protein